MKKAFTLIELLIVVAIIAILAAIAVPNFLEAQTRSKVSRVKADIRSEATALEAYAVDNNCYPNCHAFGIALANIGDPPGTRILENLSTPVAYITTALTKDVFKIVGRYSAATAQGIQALVNPTTVLPSDAVAIYNSYIYQSWNTAQRYTNPPDGFSNATLDTKSRSWLLHSAGPDAVYYNLGGVLANDDVSQLQYTIDMIYDPTNGTISRGSIWRTGGAATASSTSGTYKNGAGLVAAIQLQR
jgi:prepilin-type N-terminal cleavage/methylation domain-containing protein